MFDQLVKTETRGGTIFITQNTTGYCEIIYETACLDSGYESQLIVGEDFCNKWLMYQGLTLEDIEAAEMLEHTAGGDYTIYFMEN
jgi:hypothetical protein